MYCDCACFLLKHASIHLTHILIHITLMYQTIHSFLLSTNIFIHSSYVVLQHHIRQIDVQHHIRQF